MAKILIQDVIHAIEDVAPRHFQEDYDNTGLQVGTPLRPCHGVMLCIDVTPDIIIEAAEKGCNLIISHHPLIFHPLKSITDSDRIGLSVYKAIKNDISIYSCHTAIDNTPSVGVSWQMASMLGLTNVECLEADDTTGTGSGIIGDLPEPMTPQQFVDKVKSTFSSPTARCSANSDLSEPVRRVALCGGAGAFLIPRAIQRGAQVFLTSDCKHNHFLDYADNIFLIDIGHFESEKCTKQIFYQIIREKFPNFALCYSEQEKNPIIYL